MLVWTRLKRSSLLDRDVFAHVIVEEVITGEDRVHCGSLLMSEDEWFELVPHLLVLDHRVIDESRELV